MSERARRCDDVIERLIAALRKGEDVPADDREHIAACPECTRVLAAAGQLEDELEAEVPGNGREERLARVTQEAQAALRLERRRRAAFTILGALAVLIPWLTVPKVTVLQVLGVLVGLGAVGTVLLQRLNAGTRGVVLYKRLKGQWLFGVCRGLAEAAGLPVAVFRVGVVALLLVGRTGWMIAVPLYLLLDMSLEVHPEDRGLLLRFRLKRWLERFSAPRRHGPAGDETASS
jgi:phage shock protein PspC (stress-responsive transcriptional regulator)